MVRQYYIIFEKKKTRHGEIIRVWTYFVEGLGCGFVGLFLNPVGLIQNVISEVFIISNYLK